MTFEATTGSGPRTVTAFFNSREDASEAVEELVAAGFSRDTIRLVAGSESGQTGPAQVHEPEGFWETLKDLFMPEEDRYTYAEGLRRGGYLVTVRANEANYDIALDILDDEGTIDISERESRWRSEGWTGYTGSSADATSQIASESGSAAGRPPSDHRPIPRSLGSGPEEVIPVAEEELRIGKRDVSHGRVRVRSYVVETPVTEQVNLREEDVHIERRPVNRPLTGGEQVFQDRTIEVEERAEEPVVAKDALIREELVINKDVSERTDTISDTVRHTEVEVEDERGRRFESGTKKGR